MYLKGVRLFAQEFGDVRKMAMWGYLAEEN